MSELAAAGAAIGALPRRKHRWAEPVTVTENTGSGAQETHRRCIHCDMVKVTVHPPAGLPYRAWIAPNGVWGTAERTPVCTGLPEGLP
jgi:hypothetical protein